MRRFRWLVLLLLVLSLGFGVVYRPSPPPAPARPVPVVHQPGGLRFHRPTPVAPPSPAPSPSPVDAVDLPPPRQLAFETLPYAARSTLVQVAMDRLRELSVTCDDRLDAPVALGAFVTLDDDGLVELELRPIARDGGSLQALDEPLPEAYADCVEDLLWSQDWSVATTGVHELRDGDAVLKIALSTGAD